MDRKITILEEGYPKLLKRIDDPPKILYYQGNIDLINQTCVAVVGSRKTTPYGIKVAEEVGKTLSSYGVTVVSGFAMGIDSAAHRGAILSGGKTVAVLGCGLGMNYPASNKELRREMEEKSLFLTEYSYDTRGSKYTFPRRNRIISGLSAATVVVEAGLNSGALITASLANEQGREVYTVPGEITSSTSMGSNALLRDGATPLVVVDDLLFYLGIDKRPVNVEKLELKEEEQRVAFFVAQRGETTFFSLETNLALPRNKIQEIVTILEIKGIVQTAMGKVFIAK